MWNMLNSVKQGQCHTVLRKNTTRSSKCPTERKDERRCCVLQGTDVTVALFLEMSGPCKNVSTLSNLVQFVFLWITIISSNALNIVSITSETHLLSSGGPREPSRTQCPLACGFPVGVSIDLTRLSTHLPNMAAAYEGRIHLGLSVALLL